MSGVRIERIGRETRDLRRFFDVAEKIYADDPHWVAPLRSDLAKVLSLENPFFRHAQMQLFIARRDGADVGRIAATLDRAHNEFHGEQTAFFGYFESECDQWVANSLCDAAAAWASERGMKVLRGPTNPSLNDEAGLLIDGFDASPVFMMTYNPPYYGALLEGAGFRKAKDLFAYWVELAGMPLGRLESLADQIRRRETDVLIRQITRRSLAADLPKVREVYNAAWEKNWGFVPMTGDEIAFMAMRLRPLLDKDFVYLAEVRRPGGSLEPIAFLMALPDFNRAIAPTRGRLLPLGWLKFMLAARRIRTLRVVALGIKREWRRRGITALIFKESVHAALRRGFTGLEVSWLLEDNSPAIREINLGQGHRYKTYRLFDRLL
jgi:GNAT superfamily N-acetyltransferase